VSETITTTTQIKQIDARGWRRFLSWQWWKWTIKVAWATKRLRLPTIVEGRIETTTTTVTKNREVDGDWTVEPTEDELDDQVEILERALVNASEEACYFARRAGYTIVEPEQGPARHKDQARRELEREREQAQTDEPQT
jgi:hypothetical protein